MLNSLLRSFADVPFTSEPITINNCCVLVSCVELVKDEGEHISEPKLSLSSSHSENSPTESLYPLVAK